MIHPPREDAATVEKSGECMSADVRSLFEDPDSWQVFASGHAEGRISRVEAPGGNSGVRLDYDFHGGGGFIAMRRVISLKLPDTFEIGFLLRGEGARNHFEFKVASPGGANVWRHLHPDYQLPQEWMDYRISERELPFAWGPAGGGAPSEIEAFEIVIAAGPGGKGSLELTTASLEDQTLRAPQWVRSSSHLAGYPPEAAFDTDALTEWRSAPDDIQPWWSINFGRNLRFGGLVIEWPVPLPPRAYQVAFSHDGISWELLHRATHDLGKKSYISAHGALVQYLRVSFDNAGCAALRSLSMRPDAFSSSPNEFIHSLVADFPRGWFPRYWYREQSYWTPIGSPEGKRRALINEEGMVEVDEGSFSLEPFVITQSGLTTWADVKTSRALETGGAPLPRVSWHADGFRLDILPWVDGRSDDLTLHVTYRLKCSKSPQGGRLIVAARPFQVNPPWQAFRNLGGRSSIQRVLCAGGSLSVNDRKIVATPVPSTCGAAMFEEGGVLGFLSIGEMPARVRLEDDTGLASAAMAWEFPPGTTQLEVTVSVPYFGRINEPTENARRKALAHWKRKLKFVIWQVPACAVPAFDCFRTAAAHILINRDGPAIQPGPRRYTRSWIRDCVIMGAALAKAGVPAALHDFLTWYARFQREDGFVPCVVDRDGIDWLVEHDSHGQFLWGIREVFRNNADQNFLRDLLPHAQKAADYLIVLRKERMTNEYEAGERSVFYGLLPESASHEGYLAHPVHSYWDDFWGVRGLEAAADLADTVGMSADAERWRKEAACFQDDLLRSIDKVIANQKLAYIPGSVEWADFDPTATSNAIAMLDFAGVLPDGPLHAMLDTYLDGFRRKHRGEMQWNNYTAYEIRIIGAFVRLGKRDIVNELLDFFLSDRRPREWNQWPEITWKDPLSPGHLGDVPHTWIAAEYLLALASMVAAERESSASLVLASGMPWAWISEESGFSVSQLPTRYGPLDFRIHATSDELIHVEIDDTITIPPGGLTIVPPLPEGKRICSVISANGKAGACVNTGDEIHVHALPCVAEVRLTDR